ncbi:transporter substrate-binding domain-containing protein [Actinomadura bangladeshensis]|uniref:Transporter substrate-binding domain-containing protein n=1 Tax=Actinomadura bangladeshensis TaxID=453573 RepID=A0A4R4PAL7_9ACTN|nr:transporter substrate-binding domain-containing protein [Actinomadura bangladeshensis]TDC19631.1 transporter substrate-binding domain-containing protein [Actinomadura bangladeshensis]
MIREKLRARMTKPGAGVSALTLTALACLTGCHGQPPVAAESSPSATHAAESHFGRGKNMTVGIKPDQPQLSQQNGSRFDGFEIRLVDYITTNTGTNHVFSPVVTKDRDDKLKNKSLPMIVATYSDTPERRSKVQLVGPYIRTPQGVLVRKKYKEIRKSADLKGKSVCTTTGSTSQQALQALGVAILSKDRFGECVELLRGKQVEAVSTDLLILYGYQETSSDVVVAKDKDDNVVEIPATGPNEWMIGLQPGNKEDCRIVLAQLKDFLSNQRWEQNFTTWFSDTQEDYPDWSTRFKPETSSLGCVGQTG